MLAVGQLSKECLHDKIFPRIWQFYPSNLYLNGLAHPCGVLS